MVTVRDIIRYNIFIVSGLIHELKENVKKNAEHAIMVTRSCYAGKGREIQLVHCRHIEPRHPEWGRYKALKAQATAWLIAGHINYATRHGDKLSMDRLLGAASRAVTSPSKTDVNKALHVTRYLVNKIVENKKDFAHVAQWTRDRELEAIKAREAKSQKEFAHA